MTLIVVDNEQGATTFSLDSDSVAFATPSNQPQQAKL